MNEEDAKELARDFLSKKIKIETAYDSVYRRDPENEFCFSFKLCAHQIIGGSECVAVSKTTGAVRYIGLIGE